MESKLKAAIKKEVDTPPSEEFLHHYKTLLQSHSEPDNGEVKSCIPNFAFENRIRQIVTEEIPFGGNLIWRLMNFFKFSENLIWR